MNSRFSLILIACVLVFGGILFFNKKEAKSPENKSNTSNVKPTNHVRGNKDAKVTLTEYGDFECPACSQYYPLVEQVYDKYKDKIQFQFRNFPLIQIHQNAMVAHRAAKAASNQGKFWEMYHKLYENHSAWTSGGIATNAIRGYAEEIGLDMKKYDEDFKSEQTNAIINADVDEGKSKGVESTPTFMINGKKINNPGSADEFSKVIDEALKSNQ